MKRSSVTSTNLRSVAADSNVILAAIAGRAAQRVFRRRPDVTIVTTEENLVEVRKYVPEFAARYQLAEEVLLNDLALLPIVIYSRHQYASHIKAAEVLLGTRDPDDVPLAALALKLRIPIWSNDRDFEDVPNGVFTTARLIKLLDV